MARGDLRRGVSTGVMTLPNLVDERTTIVPSGDESDLRALLEAPAPAPDPDSRPDGGETIGERYRVEDVIGEGGMGLVLQVRHVTLGKVFALKLLRAGISDEARARQMFYREAKLASSLSHPNIVSIVDFGEDPRYGAYMVMEYIDGRPLLDHMLERRFSVRAACDIVYQIGDALHYIHQKDVLHGDVKPQNILLVSDVTAGRKRYTMKLLDFGLSRSKTGREAAVVDGTPGYLAPERLAGQPPSPSTDVYALGVLFYELLAGAQPFEGSIQTILNAHLQKPPDAPSTRASEPLDERLDTLVLRALAKKPEDRHKDMGAFLYELKTVMDMLGMTPRGRETGRKSAPAARVTTPAPAAAPTSFTTPREYAAAAIFDGSPVPMAGIDTDGRIVVANRAFAQFLTGDDQSDLGGADLHGSLLVKVHPPLFGDLRQVHISSEPLARHVTVRPADADEVHFCLAFSPGQPGSGEIHLAVLATAAPG